MNILIKTDGSKVPLGRVDAINFEKPDRFTCRIGGLVGLCDRDALFNGKPYNKEASRITGIGVFGDVVIYSK